MCFVLRIRFTSSSTAIGNNWIVCFFSYFLGVKSLEIKESSKFHVEGMIGAFGAVFHCTHVRNSEAQLLPMFDPTQETGLLCFLHLPAIHLHACQMSTSGACTRLRGPKPSFFFSTHTHTQYTHTNENTHTHTHTVTHTHTIVNTHK